MDFLYLKSKMELCIRILDERKFFCCLIEKIDEVKNYSTNYIIGYIGVQYNLHFYRVNNIISYKKNKGIGILLMYSFTKQFILRSIYKIVLEVACINYKALSLYYYYNFQINFKRINYYKNTKHCFTANNTQLRSRNYTRHCLLLTNKYSLYYKNKGPIN